MTADMVRKDIARLLFRRVGATILVCAAAMASIPAAGQALAVEECANGTEIIYVAQPLSDATSTAWPVTDDDVVATTSLVSGSLTLIADVEAAHTDEAGGPAPPVVVVVGGSSGDDVAELLRRLFSGRQTAALRVTRPRVVEGGVERRLGAPGGLAVLRLTIPLPPGGNWQRTSAEVLWELLPGVLGDDLRGIVARVEGDFGVFELRSEPELVELKLRRLRLALARFAAEPKIDADRLQSSRARLSVRRMAALENHPDAAEILLERWLVGGVEAVGEFLFGADAVTVKLVEETAREWLPHHPGAAVVVLPPRVFSPRFAPGPRVVQLANDLTAAVLERPATNLAALTVRPVVLPDVDGEVTATVLARLAAEIRSSPDAPGWVRVQSRPAILELAGPPDAFAELCEVLRHALARIASDHQEVSASDAGCRQRALRLMGNVLGLSTGVDLTPAALLRSDNISLGAVSTDAEAAHEALEKFLGGRRSEGAPLSRPIETGSRRREAVAGNRSALAVALPLVVGPGAAAPAVVAELLEVRGRGLLQDAVVDVLQPLVPGRPVLVMVIESEGDLATLEEALDGSWSDLVGPVGEEELTAVRRSMAPRLAASASGALGRARVCAAVAAGEAVWRTPSEVEMDVLTLSTESLAVSMSALTALQSLETTGAGLMPMPAPVAP